MDQIADKWKICSVLGQGSSSTVFLVNNAKTSESLAAKIFNEEGRFCATQIEREVSIHQDLKHPQIIEFKDFHKALTIEDEGGNQHQVTTILLELAPMGDLFDLLCQFNPMPMILARAYAKQMVMAVSYLHGLGIAHRDIKLENFLLDAKYGIKLTDFGLSRKTGSEEMLDDETGTQQYLSPEQNSKSSYNGFQADIFSLGVTFFVLVAGRMPFLKADKDDETYSFFMQKELEKFWEIQEELVEYATENAFFKEDFRNLIEGMLRYKATERFTIKEVLAHPWLAASTFSAEKCSELVVEVLKKKGIKR